MARLFFAIWPPAAARNALERLAQDVAVVGAGKPVEAAKMHLTLAFLGEVDQARMSLAHSAAAALPMARFKLSLDRVGSFRRSRVAWAGASCLPPQLESLQSALDSELRANGFALEERPFRPHITLARKIRERVPTASIEPIAYACEAVALVASDLGRGEYRTLESWPLGRDAGR